MPEAGERQISEIGRPSGESLFPAQSEPAPPPPHTKRITYLDGWRGFSILMVLLGHWLKNETIATIGVQMFFALSGRLMADILFVEKFPLREFYKRRLSRIYPGLLAFVLLSYFLWKPTILSFKPLAALLSLSFLLNYAMAFKHGVEAIENLWSLCIEEHSYLLLGLLAFFLRHKSVRSDPRMLLLGVAILSLADGLFSHFVLHQAQRTVLWRTDPQLAPIFLAAALYLHFRTRRVPNWLPLVALGMAFAAGTDRFLGYSVGTILLSFVIAKLDDVHAPLLDVLRSRFLVCFGLWSYSIYLWQEPFYRYFFLGKLNPLIALGSALAAGLASFYIVEQPARRWLNARWRSAPKSAAPLGDSLVMTGEGPAA